MEPQLDSCFATSSAACGTSCLLPQARRGLRPLEFRGSGFLSTGYDGLCSTPRIILAISPFSEPRNALSGADSWRIVHGDGKIPPCSRDGQIIRRHSVRLRTQARRARLLEPLAHHPAQNLLKTQNRHREICPASSCSIAEPTLWPQRTPPVGCDLPQKSSHGAHDTFAPRRPKISSFALSLTGGQRQREKDH